MSAEHNTGSQTVPSDTLVQSDTAPPVQADRLPVPIEAQANPGTETVILMRIRHTATGVPEVTHQVLPASATIFVSETPLYPAAHVDIPVQHQPPGHDNTPSFPSLEGVLDELTNREQEVAALILDGLTNQEIADKLVIELGTVKNHVHNILNKLNIESRSQIAEAMFRRTRLPDHRLSVESFDDDFALHMLNNTPPQRIMEFYGMTTTNEFIRLAQTVCSKMPHTDLHHKIQAYLRRHANALMSLPYATSEQEPSLPNRLTMDQWSLLIHTAAGLTPTEISTLPGFQDLPPESIHHRLTALTTHLGFISRDAMMTFFSSRFPYLFARTKAARQERALPQDIPHNPAQTREFQVRHAFNSLPKNLSWIVPFLLEGKNYTEIAHLSGRPKTTVTFHGRRVQELIGASSLAHLRQMHALAFPPADAQTGTE